MPPAPGGWHQWTIDEQNDRLTVTSDGKAVINNLQTGWIQLGHPMLGFGFTSGPDGGTLQVRNITVQAIPVSAPAAP